VIAVGVAVCTYRRPDGLDRLLAALPTGAPEAAVVIVVDNDGSDPRVAAAVAAARERGGDVRFFVEARPGISAARNRAFAEAETAGIGLLALIDDDEWPAPGWLAGLLRRREETGAAVVGGVVRPAFPAGAEGMARFARFWSVLPQARDGRPFVHATSSVLVDLACLRGVPRPLFDDAYGLTGGGDVVFFGRLFARGMTMAWAEGSVAFEEVSPARASWTWIGRRRFRAGNHMVLEEELRHGRLRPALKTACLALRLPIYPLLGREPEARLAGWRLEAAKVRGRIAAHLGRHVVEYARDGVGERRVARAGRTGLSRSLNEG
jgi:succinoglycan biosynthesis protein ExoM